MERGEKWIASDGIGKDQNYLENVLERREQQGEKRYVTRDA